MLGIEWCHRVWQRLDVIHGHAMSCACHSRSLLACLACAQKHLRGLSTGLFTWKPSSSGHGTKRRTVIERHGRGCRSLHQCQQGQPCIPRHRCGYGRLCGSMHERIQFEYGKNLLSLARSECVHTYCRSIVFPMKPDGMRAFCGQEVRRSSLTPETTRSTCMVWKVFRVSS